MPSMTGEVPEGVSASAEIGVEELQLAQRNHGMHLEALRYDVTPLGMHYLLIHFDVPEADEGTWTLAVGGRVRNALSLSMPDLRVRPAVTMPVTMECAGNGRARLSPRPISTPWLNEAVGTAEWTGTPLRPILDEAGLEDDALELVFAGADRGVEHGVEQTFERSLSVADAMRDEVLLAYGINGQPLTPQHGHPLRLLVPGWYGMASVKWLRQITVVNAPFEGYQMGAYRLRQRREDEGKPVTRIHPRSLMLPPGIPDYLSRRRFVDVGPQRLRGRAWSGWAPIVRVEVSADGGSTWAEAKLGEPGSPYAWVPWTFDSEALQPGEAELCSRATDADGNTQPLEPSWNLGGFANTAVQRIQVEVRPASSG